jgi:hypothetical protein
MLNRSNASASKKKASPGDRAPHILQLSGVGDPEHLAKIGVPVAHELHGVGKNM